MLSFYSREGSLAGLTQLNEPLPYNCSVSQAGTPQYEATAPDSYCLRRSVGWVSPAWTGAHAARAGDRHHGCRPEPAGRGIIQEPPVLASGRRTGGVLSEWAGTPRHCHGAAEERSAGTRQRGQQACALRDHHREPDGGTGRGATPFSVDRGRLVWERSRGRPAFLPAPEAHDVVSFRDRCGLLVEGCQSRLFRVGAGAGGGARRRAPCSERRHRLDGQ